MSDIGRKNTPSLGTSEIHMYHLVEEAANPRYLGTHQNCAFGITYRSGEVGTAQVGKAVDASFIGTTALTNESRLAN